MWCEWVTAGCHGKPSYPVVCFLWGTRYYIFVVMITLVTGVFSMRYAPLQLSCHDGPCYWTVLSVRYALLRLRCRDWPCYWSVSYEVRVLTPVFPWWSLLLGRVLCAVGDLGEDAIFSVSTKWKRTHCSQPTAPVRHLVSWTQPQVDVHKFGTRILYK